MDFKEATKDEYDQMSQTEKIQYNRELIKYNRQLLNMPEISESSTAKSYTPFTSTFIPNIFASTNISSTSRPIAKAKELSNNAADLFNQLKKEFDEKIANLQQKYDLIQAQLKEKDSQIQDLQEIVAKLQNDKQCQLIPPCEQNDIQMNQNISVDIHMDEDITVTSNLLPTSEKSATSSVVITNIPEILKNDNGVALTDQQIMEEFIQKIDPNAKITSVKRMGKKDASKTKNRPIQVSFKTKDEKTSVLKNAPEYIKSNEKLKKFKVFVNNFESPEAHRIQVKINKKKNQLYKSRGGNTSVKYFIKEKQIFWHNVITNETKLVECDENVEAAQFYKRNQKSALMNKEI